MADKTAVQEAAQAYFCSIADGMGLDSYKRATSKFYEFITYKKGLDKKYEPTFEDFAQILKTLKFKDSFLQEAYNKSFVDAPGVSLNEITKLFNEDPDWLKSSLNIAKTLFEEVGKIERDLVKITSKGWKDIFYVRGDEEIMGNISKLFGVARKNSQKNPAKIKSIGGVKFDNINKWSTADIYLGSKDAKKKISEMLKIKELDFIQLNKLISDLIDSGDLLPLSLKKQPNRVTIKKVNFNRKKEEEFLSEIRYVGKSDWKPLYAKDDGKGNITFHYAKNSKGEGTGASVNAGKYIAFYYTDKESLSKKEKYQVNFRHDPSGESGGAYKGEIVTGSEARGGSVSGEMISEIMMLFDKQLANKFKTAHTNGKKAFKAAKKEEIEFHKKFKPVYSKDNRSNYAKGKSPYDFKMSELSNKYISNELNSLLIDFFEGPSKKETRDARIRKFVEYAAATSLGSAKFVLAK